MLEVANLEVVYHSVVLVLKGVSLKVPEGGIVALLGPNGAGKTTTLRAITGLLDIQNGSVTKGRISWNGESLVNRETGAVQKASGVRVVFNQMLRNLTSFQKHRVRWTSTSKDVPIAPWPPGRIVRSGVSHVMEGRRILADLTVEENLRAGAYTAPRVRVNQQLDRFYTRFPILGERRKQKAGYLSGGEQQMLAIARALMTQPKLLVMDEPSLGLAPKLVEDVAALIKEINAEGVSILLVEQNAGMALELADYGYIMENGKVVLDGTAADLKADKDIKEFYLGLGDSGERSYREVKLYRRKKRWLS